MWPRHTVCNQHQVDLYCSLQQCYGCTDYIMSSDAGRDMNATFAWSDISSDASFGNVALPPYKGIPYTAATVTNRQTNRYFPLSLATFAIRIVLKISCSCC